MPIFNLNSLQYEELPELNNPTPEIRIIRNYFLLSANLCNRDAIYFSTFYYDPDLLIWTSVDPLANEYPNLSPFNYCVNNPINSVDPDGRRFNKKDEKKAKKLQGNCSDKKADADKDVKKARKEYEKAKKKGDKKAMAKAKAKMQKAQQRSDDMGQMVNEIQTLIDSDNMYAFEKSDKATAYTTTSPADGSTVLIRTIGSDATTVHELHHAYQADQGIITQSSDNYGTDQWDSDFGVEPEISAYRIQYSYDDGSLPGSMMIRGWANNHNLRIYPGGYNDINTEWLYNLEDNNGNKVYHQKH